MEAEKKLRSIRVWQEIDVSTIKKHLMLIDDMYGSCANCKKIGLNYLNDSTCPQCNTTFKYLATGLKNPGVISKILARIKSDSLPFTLIDRDDFERASAQDAAGNLFKQ